MRPAEAPGTAAIAPSWSGSLMLVVLTLLLVGLGVYPAPMIQLIQATVAGLT